MKLQGVECRVSGVRCVGVVDRDGLRQPRRRLHAFSTGRVGCAHHSGIIFDFDQDNDSDFDPDSDSDSDRGLLARRPQTRSERRLCHSKSFVVNGAWNGAEPVPYARTNIIVANGVLADFDPDSDSDPDPDFEPYRSADT